jgi:predicted ribonuclease YlaK
LKINFLDTSSLLIQIPKEFFIISSITLQELEKIKNSANKDYEIKQRARNVASWLVANQDKYEVILFKPEMLEFPTLDYYELNNDIRILSTAMSYYSKCLSQDYNVDFTFYTNDHCLYLLAKNYIQKVERVDEERDKYNGIKEVTLTDDEMSEYYSNLCNNIFNLYVGEYLIIKDKNGEIVDKACWTGEEMRPLWYDDFTSGTFGRLKPKKNDPYQACLFDSLTHNQVNLITGKAGSGKTLLSLAYLFSLLERKIDHIVVFCNPVVVRDAVKLGFYPGTVTEKLLSTQVGSILSSKLGSEIAVENLIEQGKLILIPVGDSRGYEVPPNSAVMVTEAQNYSIDLLRLILQRCAEDSIVIIEGDVEEQTDLSAYAGENNGIRSMSKVFRGDDQFGQIELKNIYRSHVAEKADLMGRI